jgi:very-short-patch-repair endonuclease
MSSEIYNQYIQKENRRKLRNNQTKAEKILWEYLRNRKINGKKFRRQYSINNYVLDFYCVENKLCIELDGGIHNDFEQIKFDYQRTKDLNYYGITIIRFKNDEIIGDINKVLEKINQHTK